MKPSYACNSLEHSFSRRAFLGSAAAALGFGALARPAMAAELKNNRSASC